MLIHFRRGAVRCAAFGTWLLLSSAGAVAQARTGTVCDAFEHRVTGPVTETVSACQAHFSFVDPGDPSFLRQGMSTAQSQVAQGILKVKAAATGIDGWAEGFSFASVNGGFSIEGIDPARQGEQVYVTLGAHQVDLRTELEAMEPRASDEMPDAASRALAKLTYEFDMFTMDMGSTLQWRWVDEAAMYNGPGADSDSSRHDIAGELVPYVVPMLLGETAWFRLSLTARATAWGSATARFNAYPTAYWGGITSVVDAAGRPVDYFVPTYGGRAGAGRTSPALPRRFRNRKARCCWAWGAQCSSSPGGDAHAC